MCKRACFIAVLPNGAGPKECDTQLQLPRIMEKKTDSEDELVQEAAGTNAQAEDTRSHTDIAFSHQYMYNSFDLLPHPWTSLLGAPISTWSAPSTSRKFLASSASGFGSASQLLEDAIGEPSSAEVLYQYDPVPSMTLTNKELWARFARVGNEMTISKPGRCVKTAKLNCMSSSRFNV